MNDEDVVWCSIQFRTRKNHKFQLLITQRSTYNDFICDLVRINLLGAKHPVSRKIVKNNETMYDEIKCIMKKCRDDYLRVLE